MLSASPNNLWQPQKVTRPQAERLPQRGCLGSWWVWLEDRPSGFKLSFSEAPAQTCLGEGHSSAAPAP